MPNGVLSDVVDDLHLADIDTELVGDNLGECGVMLAVTVRSGHHIDGAGGSTAVADSYRPTRRLSTADRAMPQASI